MKPSLLLLVCTIACTPRPSAELVFETPEPEPNPSEVEDPAAVLDAQTESLCAHSFAVLSGESPALRSAAIERDFLERCFAGNQAKRGELGEPVWLERAGCIEQAQTGDDLGRCDGRTPRVEPNPTVHVDGFDGRQICEHIFDMLFTENPDMANVFGPEQMGPLIDECTQSAEVERVKDPLKFDREARCLMAATTMEEFERCDEDSP